jgi:hypothetical protein
VDYSLETKAEFPLEMVLEMRGNAAKKAWRTVIGRTLGGRATFKAFQKCLKLHLPATFISATLLTRGYFLVLFENEEGAIYTRKLTMVNRATSASPSHGTRRTLTPTHKEQKRSSRTRSKCSSRISTNSSETPKHSPSWRANSERCWT